MGTHSGLQRDGTQGTPTAPEAPKGNYSTHKQHSKHEEHKAPSLGNRKALCIRRRSIVGSYKQNPRYF